MAQQIRLAEQKSLSNGEIQSNVLASKSRPHVEPPCFAIAGHHRSGTSLVASMLQSAGLDIGTRLVGPTEDNKHGHFEDMDFHDFHVEALRAQGLDNPGYVLQPSVHVPEQFATRARDLIQERMHAGRPWGWKQPRTVLFLDYWRDLIPQINYILLFRKPWEVIDSHFRRGDIHYLQNPNLAVRVWLNYNRAMLDFLGRHPDQCLLLESQAVAMEPSRLIAAIAHKFGHHFGPVGQVYDKELYSHHSTRQHFSALGRCFPEALEIYEELRGKAAIAVSQDASTSPCARVPAVDDWVLQHWADCRTAERQLKQCRLELARKGEEIQKHQAAWEKAETELGNLRTQVQQIHADLEQGRLELARKGEEIQQHQTARQQAETELTNLRTQVKHVHADLEQARRQCQEMQTAKAELHKVRTEKEELGKEIQTANVELYRMRTEKEELGKELGLSKRLSQQLQEQIVRMENSRFWKLRRWWLRLRHPLQKQRTS